MKFLQSISIYILMILCFECKSSSQWVVDVDPYVGGPYYINVVDTGTIWGLGYTSGLWDDVELYTKCPEYGWQWGNGNDLPVNVIYTCIAGINSTTAFVGDMYGHIYKTTNYGWNWVSILNAGSNYMVTDIKFSKTNRNTGYIFSSRNDYAADNFKIYKTTNYGETWQLLTPFFGNYILGPKPQVWVTDSEHAWMGLWCNSINCPNGPPIICTTNGGINWFTANVDPNRHGIEAVAFNYNNQFGIAITHEQYHSKNRMNSTNGGTEWINIDTIRQGNVLSLITIPETSIWYMNGNAYNLDNSYDPYVYKSSDNGLNWTRMTTVDSTQIYSDLDAVKLNDKIYAWAACEGRIMKLVDTAVIIGINSNGTEVPNQFNLEQNYPNPFNPATKITFDIPKSGFVRLTIYDLLGKEVEQLVNESLQPAKYEVSFYAGNLPSGVYFYKLETDGFTDTKKMILLK